MNKEDTFFDRLNQNYNNLSKKQLVTADYIKDNYKTAALMSIIPLSKEIGVSEATIVRFANVLGYKGFIEMMKDIKKYIKKELTTVDRFEKYKQEKDKMCLMYNVLSNNINILNRLSIDISNEKISVIVNKLKTAKKIVVIGFESTAPFAEYFEYHMARTGKDVQAITEKTGNLFNILNSISTEEFCISISISRHSSKQISIMKYLYEKGIGLYSITDSCKSPTEKYSTYNTYLPTINSIMKVSSLHIAILTLLQMIISEYMMINDTAVSSAFKNLEYYDEFFSMFFDEQ